MTFRDYEQDPNHITFDFIKYYYSKLSLDCSKLYQLYSNDAVIKHSESTNNHDFNTPEAIKKYWKSSSFLADSKIIILTVNTIVNTDESLVATVVGEILLESEYSNSTKDEIIPTRTFTQTFILEQQKGEDAYLIKSDILTFIPDTDYENAELLNDFDVEILNQEPITEGNNNNSSIISEDDDSSNNSNIKEQQGIAVTKEESSSFVKEKINGSTDVNINKSSSVSQSQPQFASSPTAKASLINNNTASSNTSPSPQLPESSPASAASQISEKVSLKPETLSPTSPTTSSSASSDTVTSDSAIASNNTATTSTSQSESDAPLVKAKKSSPTSEASAPSPSDASNNSSSQAAPASPVVTSGVSWASVIKTTTPASISPVPASTPKPTPPAASKIQLESFTPVRSHSQNGNTHANKKGNPQNKTFAYDIFLQFKNAAILPKEKDIEEAFRKKEFKSFKILNFKSTNATIGFASKEEQTRALEMKNILHKNVDYFIDVRNTKHKKKPFVNTEKRY